jgi:signal transduction histidine kinase
VESLPSRVPAALDQEVIGSITQVEGAAARSTIESTTRALRQVWSDRRWIVILMLGCLQFALTEGLSNFFARGLLISHFGAFLLWQPVVRADRKISPTAVILILLCGAGLLLFDSGWLTVLWITALIGILGARVFTTKASRLRWFYLLALGHLLMLLLMWAVPVELAAATIPPIMADTIRYGLFALLIIMALLPIEKITSDPGQVVDFFYGLLLFLLAIVLALGSLAFRVRFQDYYMALMATIVVAAVALLLLALLWNPAAGFGGLQTFLSRYLLSVGVPFETWLRQLAEGADREKDPAEFLSFAVAQLTHLEWVLGGKWRSPDGDGEFGKVTGNEASFTTHDLELKLYTKLPLSPALTLHVRLLAQLLGEFYEAKRREQALEENAYMRAVHETGARLTHDIKNLLQSLYSLTSAGQNIAPEQLDAYAKMVQRQLPALTKRLQMTLERLRAPTVGSVGVAIPVSEWWENLKRRYEGRNIEFSADRLVEIKVPGTVLDSVAENLLENARRKRIRESDIHISAQLQTQGGFLLSISDTGSPMPEEVASKLFKQRVSGEGGMGIGLFQACQQAEQAGYVMFLKENIAGRVSFDLYQTWAKTDTGAIV